MREARSETKGLELSLCSPFKILTIILSFAYLEHLGATGLAHTLVCRLAVLHRDGLGVFHYFFSLALHTVAFH